MLIFAVGGLTLGIIAVSTGARESTVKQTRKAARAAAKDSAAAASDIANVKGWVNTSFVPAFNKLEANVATAQGDIATMKGDLGTVKGDIATMKGDLGTVKGDIATMKGDLGTVKTELGLVKTNVAKITKGQARAAAALELLRQEQKAASEAPVPVKMVFIGDPAALHAVPGTR